MRLQNIQIKRSRILVSILLFIYAGATVALIFTDLSWVRKIPFFVLLFVSFVFHYKKYFLLRANKSIIEIEISEDHSQWFLNNYKGEVFEGELQKNIIVTNCFLLLPFKLKNINNNSISNTTIILFNDAIKKNNFKLLQKIFITKF